MSDPSAHAAFAALVHARRSVRGFRPEPLPDALIRQAFALAAQAPSNCNTQPWLTHVVSGAAAERMRAALEAAARTAAPAPDFPVSSAYAGRYRDRQLASARALYGALGIGRDDLDGRRRAGLANYRFFDAPHAAFLFMPRPFGVREAVDVGLYAQTLMLAMTALGIASCAQGALGHHPAVVRRELGVDDSQQLLFGIAFGWEDPDYSANRAHVDRAALDESVIFHA